MYYKWRGFLLAFLFPIIVSANTDGPVKLGGRLFIDGGLFTKNSYSAHAKAEITDVRLTGKITLPDEWYTKIDVGFAGNKVSLKDAFVQNKWGNNNFRIGYMFGMCCIEQSASTNDYVFMTGANAAETCCHRDRTIHQQIFSSTSVVFQSCVYTIEQTEIQT